MLYYRLMKRIATVYTILALAIYTLSCNSPIHAQYGAYTSGTKNTGIVVDKQVSLKSPGASKTTFVDNLADTEVRYAPGDVVTFTIRVRNATERAFGTVVIRDFMPEFIEPTKHEFNKGTRVVTIAAGSLQKGEEKTFTVPTRVVKNEQLPQDKTIICIVNKAQGDTAGASDQDTSQFCIERQVQGAKTVPAAGAETGYAAVALVMIGAGLTLRYSLRKIINIS